MNLIKIKGIDIRRIRNGPPKVSAQKLADFVGVSRKTIVNWENDVGCPSIIQFAKICFYCKISVGKYLMAVEQRRDEEKVIDLLSVRKDD
ncbi:helix-turn-helix transcriptional regulator [Paraneptunicella aestuarii]|uniref:helix-turn-helix transcriptional regulator n=1 Tax=Paraneptunicella aestuarii TaxID=2831148 RepID=UPI001E33782F|nr:helix-turn-helix transcriptional regulator [Paraneptunicella aestuarii]UAA38230.1 helix-turn-helix transcriptional regulator [Paraneptunicella aestuarii]